MSAAVLHDLKCWPPFFEAILAGDKTFELRRNDRNFKVGDVLLLREWDPTTEAYTGRGTYRHVTYMVDGVGPWLHPGHCCMAIEKVVPVVVPPSVTPPVVENIARVP